MKDPKSILVVVPRRLGDVLLTTPLIRTLRRGYPDAFIDVVVFWGTGSILGGNPDVRRVWEVPPKLSLAKSIRFLWRIWNRYDLALSTMIGDKPTLYAFAAGRHRVGTVPHKRHWKAILFDVSTPFDNEETHTVRQNLKLAETIGLSLVPEVVPPQSLEFQRSFEQQKLQLGILRPYIVFHPFPNFEYKKWTISGWIELGRELTQQGIQIVISGGTDSEDLSGATQITKAIPDAVTVAGKLRLSELTIVLRGALAYVGTDTSVTHLAAATGVKTIALFGPSNPVKWGPWPVNANSASNPWLRVGTQECGNVVLLQGEGNCVPCGLEGCDRHLKSQSRCLKELSVATVIARLQRLLIEINL